MNHEHGSKKVALVVGGAGFMRSHLCDWLIVKGYKIIYPKIVISILYVSFFLLVSCTNNECFAVYSIENNETKNIMLPLTDWNICGTFSPTEDSLQINAFLATPHAVIKHYETDATNQYSFSGEYHPLYNQLDLREVFGVLPQDTTHSLKGRITYLHCDINSTSDTQLYLEVKSTMAYTLFLNSDSLHRRDIQGLNIYPLYLKKGGNSCVVKVKCTGEDYSFESTIYDSISVARLYADGQSCNIIYPQIDSVSHIITLTNAHQNVIESPVTLKFLDVNNKRVSNTIELKKDSFAYHVDGLKNNTSYICEMKICNHTIRQPVLCGKDDNAYEKFSDLRRNLPNGHHRAAEIDQLLFRLQFLLNHPTRYDGDWWWQFKITPLTYQLEHTFAHLNDTYGKDDSEGNILFVTYHSEIDDSLQRYILARPNHIDSDSLPLVIIIRPNIENLHHFFACPQLARQWAVNQMQALANRYGFLIMMPEIRTYLDEDLLPIAEEELKLAIKDVQRHYPVDSSKMFLHANCSGGYRALRMATDYPDMFKAIALYAPVYHRSFSDTWSNKHKPEFFLQNLKSVPIFLHGDPIDRHSPYSIYKDLIDDCRKYDIPLTLSLKRNSGKYYNIVLAGEEAFSFFKGQT